LPPSDAPKLLSICSNALKLRTIAVSCLYLPCHGVPRDNHRRCAALSVALAVWLRSGDQAVYSRQPSSSLCRLLLHSQQRCEINDPR
jgi:hypothetical protein